MALKRRMQVFSFDLLVNAVVAGILLGGFYAAVSLGLSMSFGLLEVANIAHPVFVIAGAYVAYMMNTAVGLDPVLTGLLFTPVFYALGVVVYRIYYASFERKGEQSLRGLVFFFGILFIIEVLLVLIYGVDYRLVEAPYIGRSLLIGPIGIALRLLVPCIVGLVLTLALYLFLGKTFYGRAIMGVSQDALALRLMGADPIKIKTIAFGLGIATASLAGALLIIIAPVEPSIGREYIGRAFAITVLGGMGSISGTLVAALILGVAESLTSTFSGPSWALAVSFGILLLALAVRPSGLFGR
jgi:branched-chain amino acid transport system permease protein